MTTRPASNRLPVTTLAMASALAILISATVPMDAATTVGKMQRVFNQVEGTPPGGQPIAMTVGDAVLLDTWLETFESSGFRMTFDPEGILTIGAKTRLIIDQRQVDAAAGSTQSRIEQLRGYLRLKLSSLFSGRVRIDTPTATLGAKGTDVIVIVDPDGTTRVIVVEGVVTLTSPTAPEELEMTTGTTVTVELDRPPSQPAPYDPSATALGPTAGGPDFTRPQEEPGLGSPVLIDPSRLPIDRGSQDPP